MFYLELKDGEKIFTGAEDDDHAVFRRIIEDKLGKDALTLFKELFEYGEKEREEVLEMQYAYISRLWDIWDILNDHEEAYTDQEKLTKISDIVDITI